MWPKCCYKYCAVGVGPDWVKLVSPTMSSFLFDMNNAAFTQKLPQLNPQLAAPRSQLTQFMFFLKLKDLSFNGLQGHLAVLVSIPFSQVMLLDLQQLNGLRSFQPRFIECCQPILMAGHLKYRFPDPVVIFLGECDTFLRLGPFEGQPMCKELLQ